MLDGDDDITEAELDAMIAEQRPTMPERDDPDPPRRSLSAAIRGVLAGGKSMTAGKIAKQLGVRSRDVQQIVCKFRKLRWLGRVKSQKRGDGETLYFLVNE